MLLLSQYELLQAGQHIASLLNPEMLYLLQGLKLTKVLPVLSHSLNIVSGETGVIAAAVRKENEIVQSDAKEHGQIADVMPSMSGMNKQK